jgi:hypothetical protein
MDTRQRTREQREAAAAAAALLLTAGGPAAAAGDGIGEGGGGVLEVGARGGDANGGGDANPGGGATAESATAEGATTGEGTTGGGAIATAGGAATRATTGAGNHNGDEEDEDEDEPVVPDPVDFVQARAFKAFLRYIGFTPAAVKQILARGLSNMDSLQGQEKNQVENMCKNIERGTTGTPGIPLNSDSIKWLKLGTYAILRRQYCGWHTTAMDLTKTELKKWGKFKRSEEDYKEPTDTPTNDNNKLFQDWSKTFDNVWEPVCLATLMRA